MAVSVQAATIIVDGDTIDIDGVRIRIVQIDTCIKLQPLALSEQSESSRSETGSGCILRPDPSAPATPRTWLPPKLFPPGYLQYAQQQSHLA